MQRSLSTPHMAHRARHCHDDCRCPLCQTTVLVDAADYRRADVFHSDFNAYVTGQRGPMGQKAQLLCNSGRTERSTAFYEQELGKTEVSAQGVELLLSDNTMANLHIFMLPVNGPAPEFSREVADKARIKLENWLNHRLELDLSKDEELSLLYNADLLKKAAVALLLG